MGVSQLSTPRPRLLGYVSPCSCVSWPGGFSPFRTDAQSITEGLVWCCAPRSARRACSHEVPPKRQAKAAEVILVKCPHQRMRRNQLLVSFYTWVTGLTQNFPVGKQQSQSRKAGQGQPWTADISEHPGQISQR